jgi:hypothetical protein
MRHLLLGVIAIGGKDRRIVRVAGAQSDESDPKGLSGGGIIRESRTSHKESPAAC